MSNENNSPVFGQGAHLFVYGKRGDKQLELWPLSMADQLSMTKLIVELFQKVGTIAPPESEGGVVENTFYIGAAIDIVGDNIEQVMALVADLPADDPRIAGIKSHVTNDQFLSLVQYIWETNFASLRKNYSGLFDELGKLVKGPTVMSATNQL